MLYENTTARCYSHISCALSLTDWNFALASLAHGDAIYFTSLRLNASSVSSIISWPLSKNLCCAFLFFSTLFFYAAIFHTPTDPNNTHSYTFSCTHMYGTYTCYAYWFLTNKVSMRALFFCHSPFPSSLSLASSLSLSWWQRLSVGPSRRPQRSLCGLFSSSGSNMKGISKV